jgi:SAM-dependent methyltransferase
VGESIRFDRAAEFYDRTRSIDDDAMARTIGLLAAELRDRGRVLEVGVGTGLLALPLSAEGVEVIGLDLSAPMLLKLLEKAGGRPSFPLVLGDATRIPIGDDRLGGAYLRWVLHLIPDWRAVLAEIVRVVRPSGVFVASLGAYGGERTEISERFAQLAGVTMAPVGLFWDDFDALDRAMVEMGASPREMPSLHETGDEPLAEFLKGIEENRYSWTWSIEESVRLRALAEVLLWAEGRFGPLEERRPFEHRSRWRAYDLA